MFGYSCPLPLMTATPFMRLKGHFPYIFLHSSLFPLSEQVSGRSSYNTLLVKLISTFSHKFEYLSFIASHSPRYPNQCKVSQSSILTKFSRSLGVHEESQLNYHMPVHVDSGIAVSLSRVLLVFFLYISIPVRANWYKQTTSYYQNLFSSTISSSQNEVECMGMGYPPPVYYLSPDHSWDIDFVLAYIVTLFS